jgi:putative hemolysin
LTADIFDICRIDPRRANLVIRHGRLPIRVACRRRPVAWIFALDR